MEKLKEQYGEIIRYLVVGVMTTVVSLAVYYGLVSTVLDPKNALQLQAANVISWVAAVSFAYVANKLVVFRSRGGNVLREAASFFAASLSVTVTVNVVPSPFLLWTSIRPFIISTMFLVIAIPRPELPYLPVVELSS